MKLDIAGENQASLNTNSQSQTISAQIKNAPTTVNSSLLPFLQIQISGTDVVGYRYKIGALPALDCNDDIIVPYSAEHSVIDLIADSTQPWNFGLIGICVIGKTATGLFQEKAFASTAQWQKLDPSAPILFSIKALSALNVTGTYGVAVHNSLYTSNQTANYFQAQLSEETNDTYSKYNTDRKHFFFTSDGTPAGTHIITNPLCPYLGLTTISFFDRSFGNLSFFRGQTSSSCPLPKQSVFMTDGTEAGTLDLLQFTTETSNGFYKSDLFIFNSNAYLHADSGRLLKIKLTTREVTALSFPNLAPGSHVFYINEINNKVILAAKTTDYGYDLWTLDQSGVLTPIDINTGVNDGIEIPMVTNGYTPPSTIFNGFVYFISRNPTSGYELFRTDGTTFQLVKDHTAGAGSTFSGVNNITNYKNILLITKISGNFYESDGAPNGIINVIQGGITGIRYGEYDNRLFVHSIKFGTFPDSLWVTTGTVGGFTLIRSDLAHSTGGFSIITGAPASYHPAFIVHPTLGVFFPVVDVTAGLELYHLDINNESSGGALLKDINPGSGSLWPQYSNLYGTPYLMKTTQNVFFYGSDGISGTEIYITDGTTNNTQMLKDIFPGNYNSANIQFLGVYNDHPLFFATDPIHGQEVWTTDGTTAGTVLFADINTQPKLPQFQGQVAVGSRLFFIFDNYLNGKELWSTDGTPGGTRFDYESAPGNTYHKMQQLVSYHDNLYFINEQPNFDSFIWQYSPVTQTNQRVLTALPQTFSGNALTFFLHATKDWLFFEPSHATEGFELWRTDGTDANSLQLTNRAGNTFDWGIGMKASSTNRMYYTSYLIGDVLYASGGETATTTLVSNTPYIWIDEPIKSLGAIDVFADSNNGPLYRSDGTLAGTSTLGNFTWSSVVAASSTQALISGDDGISGTELWITDGTTIEQIADFNTGSGSGSYDQGAFVENKFYFPVFDSVLGETRIKSYYKDLTGSHLETLNRIDATVNNWIATNHGIIFSQNDSGTGNELYYFDARTHQLQLLTDLNPGVASSDPIALTPINNYIVFKAINGSNPYQYYSVFLDNN